MTPIRLPGFHSPPFFSHGGLWFVTHFLQTIPHCCFSLVSSTQHNKAIETLHPLTGTMPKLEADMCTPEFIHGDRKFQQLGPPGAVVMIKHKGVVLASRWLSRAEGYKILTKETCRLKTASFQDDFGTSRTSALLCLCAPKTALNVKSLPQSSSGLFLHLLLWAGCVWFILRLVSQDLIAQRWTSVTYASWATACPTWS